MIRVLTIFRNFAKVAPLLVSMAIAVFGSIPAQALTLHFVQNGDFTATDLASPGGYICKSGATCVSNVTDWSSTCNHSSCGNGSTAASLLFPGTNGSVFNGGNGLWGTIPAAPGGGNIIAIDGDPTYGASISQTINGLRIGTIYTLTFDQAAAQQHGSNGATTERWTVSLGADTQHSALMTDPSHGVQPWALQTMSFTASSTSEVLSFLAVGTPNGVPPIALLSDVDLSLTVPEPATWAIMIVGVALLGGATRRRRAVAAVA